MKITASSDSLRTLAVDAIAVIVYEDEQTEDLAYVNEMSDGLVGRLIELGEIKGKLHEVTSIPLADGIAADRIIIVGGGKTRRTRPSSGHATSPANSRSTVVAKRNVVAGGAVACGPSLDAGRLAQSAG